MNPKPHIPLLTLLLLAILPAFTQLDTLQLGQDTVLCEGSAIILDAGAGHESYLWSTGSETQTIVVDSSGVYWCQVPGQDSVNHIINGDFELGNTGFYTDYIYSPDDMWPEGTYTVSWDPSIAHGNFAACGDHTTGEGMMMVVNGATVPGLTIWMQSVNISPNMEYTLELWTTSVVSSSPAELTLMINGEMLTVFDLGTTLCLWEKTSETWNSGAYGVAEISLVDFNLIVTGNDFAIDDIVFYSLSPSMDTSIVTILFNPDVSLGNDTSLCIGQTITLNAGTGYDTYAWQDGSSGQTFNATLPGWYSVTVTNEFGCMGTDSLYINLDPGPEISLGNDTTLCSGESLELNPGMQYSEYLWQDDSQLPFYIVTTTGYYSVTVTDYFGCITEDEIFVDISWPEVDLGADTIICEGSSLLLDVGDGFMNYAWSDSSELQFLEVTEGGIYQVTVTDHYGCQNVDTIVIEEFPIPWANLGIDTSFCSGDTMVIQGPPGNYEYYWNGDEGDQLLKIIEGGTYVLEVINACGSATDDIKITEYPLPPVDLGEDRVIMSGETILLCVSEGFQSYLWNDGSSECICTVTEASIDPEDPYFYVEVSDLHCKNSDTVRIDLCKVWIPNVITPNGDGLNDIFSPDLNTWHGILQHKIRVFNRWGEIVWESENFQEGWDGKVNGRYTAAGTYFWVLEIKYGDDGLQRALKGTLSVLGTYQ